jgi:uncharacterized protein YeaO (DUF488 family)
LIPDIRTKRVYEPSSPRDGKRFLVDRIWPRGVSKEGIRMSAWVRPAAPSAGLCKWFGHDPVRWEEFKRMYFVELDQRTEAWRPLRDAAARGTVTLVYGAKDTRHNQAVALKEYLESKLKPHHQG